VLDDERLRNKKCSRGWRKTRKPGCEDAQERPGEGKKAEQNLDRSEMIIHDFLSRHLHPFPEEIYILFGTGLA